jgi:hypothetical protein
LFFVLRKQFVSAAIVLAVCAHAGALPTMVACEGRLSIETGVMSGDAPGTCGINEYAPSPSYAFVDAAQGFSEPVDICADFASPQNLAYSITQASQDNNVKNLPAVPGAVLMVVVGFLCISLVRDRKVWVSVVMVVVVLSQAGVRTLPKLTARLAQCKLTNRPPATLAIVNPISDNDSFNWFGNPGKCHYIGLLRRLASSPGDRAFTVISQPLIIPVQHSFNPLVRNLADRIISIVRFSPAFIFGNLARSPPIAD